MENKISCGIVRDLLPSYVDGLTGEETNAAIEEHIEGCAGCAEALRLMREPEIERAEPEKQVDYLKKLRRRSTGRSLIVGIILMLIGMSMLCYRFFYIGSVAERGEISYSVTVVDDTVYAVCTPAGSGLGISRVSFSDSAGIVSMKVYTVPKTFLSRGEYTATYKAGGTVGQLRFDGLIIWEEGVSIGNTASRLFEAANPFVGDMPANGRIADIIGISGQFGSYTSELNTDEEPYGWVLKLDSAISPPDTNAARKIMRSDSYLMLALVENLGYVKWEYEEAGEAREYTVKADDATAFMGQDIKRYGQSASMVQELVEAANAWQSVVSEVLQEDGSFVFEISNYSDAEIYSIAVKYYLDGGLVGTSVGQNADGRAIKKGDKLSFEFTPEDFPEGTSAIDLTADFSFDVIAADGAGSESVLCEGRQECVKYAWTYFYSITDGADGRPVIIEG